MNCLIDIDIDIFKNDHIDIDIDIDIFQKCRYIDNRYVISIYRTGLVLLQASNDKIPPQLQRADLAGAGSSNTSKLLQGATKGQIGKYFN